VQVYLAIINFFLSNKHATLSYAIKLYLYIFRFNLHTHKHTHTHAHTHTQDVHNCFSCLTRVAFSNAVISYECMFFFIMETYDLL